jgi:hypothetical protein
LSKKIEQYFGLRQKRENRRETRRKSLENKQKENEKKVSNMLEQNIIDDIGVNFLFRRGNGLREGLIDIDRAYKIVKKIDSTFKESQLKVTRNKEKKIRVENDEDKIYNFDFIKFFQKSDLDEKSVTSQNSFYTSSSVPKKAD